MSTTHPTRTVDDPILHLPDVITMTGLSTSTVQRKRNPSSNSFDADFPMPYRLAPGRIGWRESELREWLERVKIPHPERAS